MKRVLGLKIGSIDPSEPSGGQECAYQLYAQLAEEFDVHVLSGKSLVRRMGTTPFGPHLTETVLPLLSLLGVYAFDRFLRTGLLLLPPKFYDRELSLPSGPGRRLKKEFSEADLILLETWLLLPTVLRMKRPNTKILYRPQNVDALFYQQMVPPSVWARRKDLIKSHEREVLIASDAIAAVSEEDLCNFGRLYDIPPEKMTVIPVGANTSEFEPDMQKKDEFKRKHVPGGATVCAFIGTGMAHNNEIARYIALELAPRLPECVFLIMGKCGESLKGLGLPRNVRVAGFLPAGEFRAALAAIDIALNPATTGSGMSIKMLTYLTAGIPTVTSPFGARGLDVEDGKHVVLAELEEFPKKVQQVLKDVALRRRLSEEGRKLALTKYDLRVIGDTARGLCRGLIG